MSEIAVRNVVSPDGGVADNLKPVTAFAWINFNAQTNVINDSYNILSITDNGTGSFTLNLSSNLPNLYPSVNITSNTITNNQKCDGYNITSTSTVFVGLRQNGGTFDPSQVSCSIFGGQS